MRWWVELAIGALALVGLWVTVDKAAAGVARVWARVWRSANPDYDGDGWDWSEDEPADEDDSEELPPERSEEELGFTGPQRPRSPTFLERLEARRERLASAAELEHRAAYEAMGLDYPSGLMARVREAAP